MTLEEKCHFCSIASVGVFAGRDGASMRFCSLHREEVLNTVTMFFDISCFPLQELTNDEFRVFEVVEV